MKIVKKIVALLLVLTILGLGGGVYYFSQKLDETTAEYEAQIVALNETIESFGTMTPVFRLKHDVSSGKKITQEDIELVDINSSAAEDCITNFSQVKGSYYKLSYNAGTVLTTSMLFSEKLTDDKRYIDVVTHNNPIGITGDTYVDIRIAMPMGEDYIGLAHKKVVAVNSGVLKIIGTEEDIHVYQSMLVDSMLYPGAHIYAVEYVEGAVQKGAEAYYPVSPNVLAIAMADANILNLIEEDMLARREVLDIGLTQVNDGIEAEELQKRLTEGKIAIQQLIEKSQQVLSKERAELEAKQKALEEGLDSSGSSDSDRIILD